MFKQAKYQVLFATTEEGKPVWKEKEAKNLTIANGVFSEVETTDGIKMLTDEIGCFVRECTMMYDKAGAPLYGGDIVKVPIAKATVELDPNKEKISQEEIDNAKKVTEMLLPIVWVNAAWCLVLEDFPTPLYLDQNNVRHMEKVGDIHRNLELIEKPIDEKIFEKPAQS